MEFIICDSNKMELGMMPDSMVVDLDVGKTSSDSTNDVEVTCERGELDYGMYLICPGTEYGAPLEEVKESTNSNQVKWYGDTFRGFLEQKIIEPPAGQAYYTASGDAHDIMRAIIGSAFEGMFTVPETASGIEVKSYQFNRYTDVLTGFTKMLAQYDARVNIEIVQGGSNEPFRVELTAVPIQNLSEEIEYSQDSGISVDLQNKQRGITHLICLGQGELQDRTVVHLYLQADGSIEKDKPYYTGFWDRQETYDYSSAEDEDELISYGKERLESIAPSKSMDMNVEEDVNLQIGDIISGRNYETGLYLAQPIREKIVSVKKGLITTQYKVEGSE